MNSRRTEYQSRSRFEICPKLRLSFKNWGETHYSGWGAWCSWCWWEGGVLLVGDMTCCCSTYALASKMLQIQIHLLLRDRPPIPRYSTALLSNVSFNKILPLTCCRVVVSLQQFKPTLSASNVSFYRIGFYMAWHGMAC